MTDVMCCCPFERAVTPSTDCGTVTWTPCRRESLVQTHRNISIQMKMLGFCWQDLMYILMMTGLLPWVKLIDNFDAEYEYVTNEGTVFTFKTNLDAPQYRLINIDFAQPSISQWKELIPQHDKDVIGEQRCCFNEITSNQTSLYLLSQWMSLVLLCLIHLQVIVRKKSIFSWSHNQNVITFSLLLLRFPQKYVTLWNLNVANFFLFYLIYFNLLI